MHPVLHLNTTRSKQTGKVHLTSISNPTFVAKEKEFRLDTLFCNIIIQIMPEERIPKVKAQNKMLKYLICEIQKKKTHSKTKNKKTRSGFDFRSAVY